MSLSAKKAPSISSTTMRRCVIHCNGFLRGKTIGFGVLNPQKASSVATTHVKWHAWWSTYA